VLRLDGRAFREALASDPSIATGVLRTLVRRLRAR
jgi:CRP-like cAMP-binding protein